jgi:orotidine-5'-phosphate decarboxylase
MVKAAVEGAQGGCRVMGVTVLTSFDARGLARAWGRAGGVEIGAEVERLAGICVEAGAHGLVCSGQELSVVRRAQPELRPLVPGIRFADGEAHDQARVMTPGAAARGGAAYIVLGRAVTGASDPVEAMGRVLAELRT